MKLLKTTRLLLSALAVLVSVVTLAPDASAFEPPCTMLPDVSCYTDATHIWAGHCEGVDCYYEYEICCPKPE
jgi:hypothetical protein